ncbi:MAG: hypothetical protein U1D30_19005 [Planctomycetota bacterium]
MVFQAARVLLAKGTAGDNLITLFYAGPKVHWHFSYFGFSWIKPFPQPWMNLTVHRFSGLCVVRRDRSFYRVAIAGDFRHVYLCLDDGPSLVPQSLLPS